MPSKHIRFSVRILTIRRLISSGLIHKTLSILFVLAEATVLWDGMKMALSDGIG